MKKRLLILVEDDDALLLTLKRALESEGYLVLLSQHPIELLEKMDLMRPALIHLPIAAIISDIQMPGDGETVIKELAADPDFSKIPVIPMSASERDRLFGKKVIKKPFTIDEVIEAIEQAQKAA